MANGSTLLKILIVIGFVGFCLFYAFSSDIQFKQPSPVTRQEKDTSYMDSINYVIYIYQLERKQFDLKQHEKIYEWQHKSTIAIFIMVVSVVYAGLYLSYKQFELTNKIALLQTEHQLKNSNVQIKGSQDDKTQNKMENTSFEIGKSGIKITSAVIGLIILAMSIAFFILYLKFIYPINLPK